MSALFLAGALGLAIDCNQITSPPLGKDWQSQVCNKLQAQYDDVQLVVIKVTDLVGPDISLNRVQVGDLFAGRIKVSVPVNLNGQQAGREYLLSVQAIKDVMVATRSVYKGRSLQDGDAIRKRVNVAPFIGLKEFTQVNEKNTVLKKTLKRNEIIFSEYFENEKIIMPRQSVDVVIVSGDIAIKAKGIAIDSAEQIGSEIRVKVVETGVVVKGTVKMQENLYVEI